MDETQTRRKTRLELVVPALRRAVRRLLWPPFYNKIEPSWIGMPFFYWYQLLWVIIGAVLTAIVYFATEAIGAVDRLPAARDTDNRHGDRRARGELDPR